MQVVTCRGYLRNCANLMAFVIFVAHPTSMNTTRKSVFALIALVGQLCVLSPLASAQMSFVAQCRNCWRRVCSSLQEVGLSTFRLAFQGRSPKAGCIV